MAVTISFGGIPVPKGWKLWNSHERPDPGRWFLEIRYNHAGHWKVGLDYRPIDGAFPSFWMHPFLWKYATEIESICKMLDTPLEKWGLKLLKFHPSYVPSFKEAVEAYGEKAKKKKKLLFGSAEGLGIQDAKVPANLSGDEDVWPKMITGYDGEVKFVTTDAKEWSNEGIAHSWQMSLDAKAEMYSLLGVKEEWPKKVSKLGYNDMFMTSDDEVYASESDAVEHQIDLEIGKAQQEYDSQVE